MPALTPPPEAPQRGNRATFSPLVDAFLSWLVRFVPQINALVAGLNARDAGGAYTFAYTFDSSTANSDPGSGKLRLDAATQNQAIAIRLDNFSDANISISGILDSIQAGTSNTKGSVRLEKVKDPNAWIIFDILSVESLTGYKNLTVEAKASSSTNPFVNGDQVITFFNKAGDRGDGGNTPTAQEIRNAIGVLPIASGGTAANTAERSLENLGAVSKVNLLAQAGSSSVGFVTTGTGATTRTVQEKLREVVSVKDFGAKGDGATDDTAAIQKAHDAARCVYYPYTPNGYRITSTITISQNNTTIMGDAGSNFASYINLQNHAFDVYNVSAASGFEVHDFAILNFGTKTPSRWAFRFNHTSGINMSGVRIYACHSGLMMGLDTSESGGSQSRLQNVDILQLGSGGGIGIYKGSKAEILEILDGVIAGPGTGANGVDNCFAGIQLRQGAAVVMRNLEIIGCGKPVYANPPSGASLVHTTMHNVWCDSSSDIGLALDGSAGPVIDFRVTDSWASSCNTGIRVSGFVRGLKLGGMTIITNRSNGITIDDNADVTGFAIHDSEIAGNAGTGVSVGANVSGFNIHNNVIGGGSHFGANLLGVFLGTGVENYRITCNDIRRNTNGQVVGHLGKSVSKIVSENIGFITYNSASSVGTTDAGGLMTFSHGLYKVPSDVRITMFGGPSTSPMTAQISSLDQNNVVVRFFNGTGLAANSGVTFYWEAAA